MEAFRHSHIVRTYEYRGELLRHAASMEYTHRVKSDDDGLKFRDDFLAYLRDIGRCMGNEVGNDSSWVGGGG